MFGILSAGIAPGLALISYFYLRDQYGQEPVANVFKLFLIGAILTFPVMFMQYVIEAEKIIGNEYLHSFISAGFLEEFFKWFILLLVVYPHADFDEPYDGIVYGASISLGFATLENIFYLLGNGIEFAMGRALLPVSSHALFGVLMGYYLGKAKFDKENNSKKWLFLSFFIPFIFHGFYDSILLGKRWIYYIIPFMLFLWYLGLKKTKQAHILSKSHLENKCEEETAAF